VEGVRHALENSCNEARSRRRGVKYLTWCAIFVRRDTCAIRLPLKSDDSTMLETATPDPSNPIAFISFPTPLLRALVIHYRSTMSASDFENVLFNIREFFDKSTAQLLAAQSGAGRAELLHHMMDHELKASASMEVSCRKGCGGCCHYEVEVTQDESELLAEIITNGFSVDLKRLETQATYERQGPEWAKFWSAENRCVFLSAEGSCGIYEDRPSICRKHSVITPASSCTTLGEQVTPVQVPLAEILLSAALSIPGAKHASLSKMVLATLNKTSEHTSKTQTPFLEANEISGL